MGGNIVISALVLVFLKGMHMSPVPQVDSATFGNFDFAKNPNSHFLGSNNKGLLDSNTNSMLDTTNCQLNLKDNKNAHITALNSKIETSNCDGIQVAGEHNKIAFNSNVNQESRGNHNDWEGRSNVNFKVFTDYTNLRATSNINGHFQTQHATVVAGSNTNLKVLGECNNLQANSNINAHFDTARATVVAASNTNLRVTGNDFTVTIRNTVNHNYHHSSSRSLSDDQFENRIEISQGDSSDMPCTEEVTEGCGPKFANKPRFTLDFVDDAVIDGPNYQVGEFAFTIKPDYNNSFDVELNNGLVNPFTHDKQTFNGKELLLTTTKNGVTHTMRIIGGLVTPTSDHTFRMFL